MLALGAAAWLALDDPPPRSGPGPSATPAPREPPPPAAGADRLALGITEPNPNFLWPAAERSVPQPFARWGEALADIRPDYYRLVVEWRVLQPREGDPADLVIPQGGCSRADPPCAGWLGVREQLRALAARQRSGGWDGVMVITGTPGWAAEPAGGCERPETEARSRRVRAEALPAYRRLVAGLLAAGREAGARLDYWSPWNEPNHPYFLSPQREACERTSASLAPRRYAELARALLAELDAAPGEQRLVLGELAGYTEPSRHRTDVREFLHGLPDDLVCRADVWAQHYYVGGEDPLDAIEAGLAGRGCPRAPPVWITETGVGSPRRTSRRPARPRASAAAASGSTAACATGTPTRAWAPRSSTRCARTSCSAPAS